MISGFLRWLSLSFCLLLSWSLLAIPQTLLPQPALTIQTEAAGEKEAQLQSAETLNKKRSGAPSTPLMTGGGQPVLAAQLVERRAGYPSPRTESETENLSRAGRPAGPAGSCLDPLKRINKQEENHESFTITKSRRPPVSQS